MIETSSSKLQTTMMLYMNAEPPLLVISHTTQQLLAVTTLRATTQKRKKKNGKTGSRPKKIRENEEHTDTKHITNSNHQDQQFLSMSLHLRNHRERMRDARIVSKTCSAVAIRSATDATVASAVASAVSDLSLSISLSQ